VGPRLKISGSARRDAWLEAPPDRPLSVLRFFSGFLESVFSIGQWCAVALGDDVGFERAKVWVVGAEWLAL